ncbi:OmpA family protein [Calidifontibacter indicus]|uniref:OmpA family protein n=1 Tax=Calidifontibacter indicus TaxID=419650 RepID=UPI003D73A06C
MSHRSFRRIVPSVLVAATCVGLTACNSGDATVSPNSASATSTTSTPEDSAPSTSSDSGSSGTSSGGSSSSSGATEADEQPTAPSPTTDPGRADTLTTSGGWIVSGSYVTFVYRSGTRYVVDTGTTISDPKTGTYKSGKGTLTLKNGQASWAGNGLTARATVNRQGAGSVIDRTGVIAITADGSVACATDKKLAFVTSDGRRGNASTGGAIFVDASGKRTTIGKPGDQGTMVGRYSVCNVGGRSSVEAFDDVLFEFNSDKLSPTGAAFVKAAAMTIAPEVGGRTVRVVGHTDSKGTPAANMALGMRRATTVSNELKRLIPGLSTEVRSAGQTQPTAPNVKPDGSDDPQGRAMNRRVEISWKQ